MNTTTRDTVAPATTRAAFRRAGKRLAEQGILLNLSNPTCCRSCARFEAYDSNPETRKMPFVIGYRIDGKMNDRNMFTTAWSPEWYEYLGWDNKTMPEGEFLVAVARALMAEGFTVEIPESIQKSIAVRYTKEVK